MSFSPDFAFFSREERLQLLGRNCPRHLTNPRLRTWHSYREGRSNEQRKMDRWAGEQRDVRSFLLPNFRARMTVFSSQTSTTLSFLESCEAHKKCKGRQFHWELKTLSIWFQKCWCFLIEHQFSEHSARVPTGCKLVFHPQSWISTDHNRGHDELLC